MKKFFLSHQYLFLAVGWISYWVIVILRQALNRPILPIHDGVIGLLLILVTLLVIWLSPATQLPRQKLELIPTWGVFLLLQVLIVTQVFRGVPIARSLVFTGLMGVMVLLLILEYYHLPFFTKLVSRTEIQLTSWMIPMLLIFLLILSTSLPWTQFVLIISGMGITLSFWTSLGIHVLLGFIFIQRYNTFPNVSESLQSKKYSQNQTLHSLGLVGVGIGFIALILYIFLITPIPSQVSNNDSQQIIRPRLVEVSSGWRIDPDLYQLPISTGESQTLDFWLFSSDAQIAEIYITAYIQAEAGRVRWEILEDGAILSQGVLPSFRCDEWYASGAFQVRTDCNATVEKVSLDIISLKSESEYQVNLITVPYTGPITFTPQGTIKQGEIRIGPPRFMIIETTE